MKKLLLIIFILSFFPTAYVLAEIKYQDYYDISNSHIMAVERMDSAGIVKGFSDGNFKPTDFIIRQDATIMFDRLFKYVEKNELEIRKLSNKVNYLENKNNELKEVIDDVSDIIENMDRKVKDFNDDKSDLDEDIKKLELLIESMEDEMDGYQNNIKEYKFLGFKE